MHKIFVSLVFILIASNLYEARLCNAPYLHDFDKINSLRMDSAKFTQDIQRMVDDVKSRSLTDIVMFKELAWAMESVDKAYSDLFSVACVFLH
jgi:trans-2-enoyl-CoA reductase